MTDKEMLEWILANVTYLEHSGEQSYWPHTEWDLRPKEDFVGLSLREYIERVAK